MAKLQTLMLVVFIAVCCTLANSQVLTSVPRNVASTTRIRGPQNVQGADRKRLGCVLQPVPNSINKYRVHLFSLGTSLDFYCAQGTIFYPDKCACDWPKDRNMVLPAVPTTIRPQTRPFPDRTVRPGRRPVIDNVRPFMTTTPEPCRFRADPDRNFYQEFVIGFGWSKRPCPIGTLYREESCKCDDIAPVSTLRCRAELYVPFDVMPIADGAGTSIPIGNNGNVDSVANAGRFDGSGRLTIWMYSNMDFGELLTINLRFYDFPGGQEEQVLVSNCFDKELGSIEIATRPRKKEVVFRGNTAQSGPVEIALPYQEKMWKNVTYAYDGSTLTGKVNGEEKSIPLRGNLDIRFSGFEIGMCNGRGYVGYVDELRVYRCVNHFGLTRPNNNFGFTRRVI
ncbi:shell matrix protein-like [Pecten maximus]|uniref:shell matrix protein-like n=1 Tax=Pecten maximus TaxID=6579 RepID=UPI00145861F2|nr:shell matrix protein-like [Pecten maximus]